MRGVFLLSQVLIHGALAFFLACFSLSISVLANLWSSTSDGFSHLLIKFSNTFHLRKSVFPPPLGLKGTKFLKIDFAIFDTA